MKRKCAHSQQETERTVFDERCALKGRDHDSVLLGLAQKHVNRRKNVHATSSATALVEQLAKLVHIHKHRHRLELLQNLDAMLQDERDCCGRRNIVAENFANLFGKFPKVGSVMDEIPAGENMRRFHLFRSIQAARDT